MFRIITIIKKELYDLVRDRRTMFFMAIFPAVIIPLLIGGVAQLSIFFAKKEMDKTLNIAIIGEQYLPVPGLADFFKGLCCGSAACNRFRNAVGLRGDVRGSLSWGVESS